MLSPWLVGVHRIGHAAASRWPWLAAGSLSSALVVIAGTCGCLLSFTPRHVLSVWLIAQADVPLARGLYPTADRSAGVPAMPFTGIHLPSETTMRLQQITIRLYHPMKTA